MTTEREIHEMTGFDNGEKFSSEAEVRDYFTIDAMRQMFGDLVVEKAAADLTEEEQEDNSTMFVTQDELDAMAAAVIANRWHCAF